MTSPRPYRWPTKVHRYGIADPCLRVLVAKYESEIPWERVRSASALAKHVEEDMLPRLLARVAYPPTAGVKHCYVEPRHVDVDLALSTDPELDKGDVARIVALRASHGPNVAREALADLVNARKAAAFQAWVDLVRTKYASSSAFAVLLLRPLFELSGPGTRRTLFAPNEDVVEWIRLGVVDGRLTPTDDLARAYCMKVARGHGDLPLNGWHFVPVGTENALRLSAACRGSGWCVADPHWGRRYLAESDFYILRSNGHPVVAMSISPHGGAVLECQGRGNMPAVDWADDIAVFLATHGVLNAPSIAAMRVTPSSGDEMSTRPLEWWRERCRYWPFAVALAPEAFRATLKAEAHASSLAYCGFRAFGVLAPTLGLTFRLEDWRLLVAVDPSRYLDCPPEVREDDSIKQACLEGWIDRGVRERITLFEVSRMPAFVSADRRVAASLVGFVQAIVEKRPRSYHERRSGSGLKELLPLRTDSLHETAVLHAVDALLRNQTGLFGDASFSSQLRDRSDFAGVRERAWFEATRRDPALCFALPVDLRELDAFRPTEGEPRRVDLAAWVKAVLAKPWILSQKNGVPKAVRHHVAVLDAYLTGWARYLESTPWRLWVLRSREYGTRVYLSPAAYYEPTIVDALTVGFANEQRDSSARRAWQQASSRTQSRPPVQLALLRAILAAGDGASEADRELLRSLPDLDRAGAHVSDRRVKSVLDGIDFARAALRMGVAITMKTQLDVESPSTGNATQPARERITVVEAPLEPFDWERSAARRALVTALAARRAVRAEEARVAALLHEQPTVGGEAKLDCPKVGDHVRHPLFGECRVRGYRGSKIRLKQVGEAREGEFDLASLVFSTPTALADGTRSYTATPVPQEAPRRRRAKR